MLGRDVDSIPTQFRTWIVNDNPDYKGQLYTGLKSGPNPIADISAYIIYDSTVVADFNLPNAVDWEPTRKVLPGTAVDSQLAIIDGYAYLFGGKSHGRIYRAATNRPAIWTDTGATLPSPLYSSQLAIVNNTIYLFGGNSGGPTSHIFSAPISNPLVWTDRGALLPSKVSDAQLLIANENLYLLGGRGTLFPQKTIYTASSSNPLSWSDTGQTLPINLYKSQAAIIDGYAYLLGGLSDNQSSVNYVFRAPLSNLGGWTPTGSLPYPAHSGQFFEVGDKGYLITSGSVPGSPRSRGTRILSCNLSNPNQWIDTLKSVPGEVSGAQVGIINDCIFLFGGSGNTVIYVNASVLKYNLGKPTVVDYGITTRTDVDNTPNKLDLFGVLGFPYWKTDYGS